ncbi:MAG: PQQ-binding-like beta-propeller repeat protein, partial [Chloroflexi bacterium]|nr:PQQ-binding-like beta-propeller repeat protein [Chloroflexota bacterium]
ETKIEQDYGRRWWNAQVAVGNGVLVCPTTVGWLVAVDRTSHAILWAYRYSQPAGNHKNNFNNRQAAVVPYSAFNQRWSPSAPIIVGNHVVYTPSEYTNAQSQQTSVICLNLFDGTRLWQKPKGTFRYLAGVFDERVVLVGTNSVTALSLDNGTTLWSRPISNADGRPAGFGVAVGNREDVQVVDLLAARLE